MSILILFLLLRVNCFSDPWFVSAQIKDTKAQPPRQIVVAPDGSGDYKTIQAAIESVSSADADIYWVTTAPNPILWGKRVYYQNCHRAGGDYAWHKDNLAINPASITVAWTFDGRWNPH